MTTEEFQKLIAQCQPHKVFSNDWKTFYSIDFADTLLPDVKGYIGKAMWMYDGGDLFKDIKKAESKVLKVTNDKDLISLVSYSYPKGVEAERKKNRVQVGDHEICTFIEVSQDDKIELSFKIGNKYKEFLKDYYKSNKLPYNSNSISGKTYTTNISDFKKHFNRNIVHYNMMLFVGNTIGVNLAEVNDKIVLKVKLNSIKAQTTEPAANKDRKEKEKQHKFILIDFEILNQPAINYSLHIYKGKDKIFEQVFLSAVTVTASKKPKDGQAPKLKKSEEENYHQPGKYQIVWVCTDNGVFDEKDEKQKLTIKIQATGVAKQIAIAEKEILIKETVEQAEADNFIILEDSEGGEIKVFGSQIIERQKKFVSKIPKETIAKLSDEGRLILNLSIIMTKLNLLYGALCQIHWLEGSKTSLKFPYEFFMSEKRVENIDRKNLEEYFKELRYLSVDNLGYTPSNPDGVNLFLFNDSIPRIKNALELFNKNLEERSETGVIGNYENIATHIDEEVVTKTNLFQSFSIGSEIGDIDDVGMALGRYSQRCYFKGFLSKNTDTDKWILEINEVGTRFADEFSFEDKNVWYNPLTWGSQNLGYWKNDIEQPDLPVRTILESKYDWLLLENSDFRELKKTLEKSVSNSCNDFFIYSDIKIINDEIIETSFVIL